ncbi:MAG TPA: ABC transporter substrate-binding protein [Thermomicrobiaceae bacterium]|nr:ABC transporter substrate-binding protein [Thermomicrobiaceae bacterium]
MPLPRENPRGPSVTRFGRELSRRAFLKRAAAFGVAVPVVGGLLAACGSSSSSSSGSSSASSAASSSAATPSGAGSATASTTTSTPASSPAGSPVGSPTGSPQASTGGSAGSSTGGTTGQVGASFKVEQPTHQGGQVIEGTFADAETLCSILSTDTSSGACIDQMFNGVMQADPSTANPTGDMAKSWEISSDGITYTFTLDDGITWHDGQPCTTADIKFTYDLAMNPATNSPRTSELVERVKSVAPVDDSHITFTLKQPVASFIISNMGYGILPQHILQNVAPKALAQDPFSTGKKGRTIGTGPFMFQEWVKDDHMTLNKNPKYWKGTPVLDSWIYKIVTNQTVLTQQLKTGEVDIGGIQPSDFASMQKQSNVNTYAYDGFTFTFYCYQLDPTKTTLFQDKGVRQALLYALNRAQMVKAIDFGLAQVAVGTMPVPSWAYNPNGITNKYPYDVDKANSLLDSAGWAKGSDGIRAKNGKKLSFSVYTNSGNTVRENYITVFQQAWKELGVDCTPQTEEWNAFLNRITSAHDFEIFLVGFSWGVDPDQTTMWACDSFKGGFNMGKYCNPQVDTLLQQGLATTDHAKRTAIYTQMQNILMDDLPSAILDFPKSTAAVNKRVHNVFPNAVDPDFHWNSYQWWVDA